MISSVFGPLKGSCRAEGEEKITGADIICFCHVDLTSGLTHCGPVLYGCQVNVPAHMLWHDARASPTRSDTRVQPRGDGMRACSGQRSTSHTPTLCCAQTDALWALAFSIVFASFRGSCLQGFTWLDLIPPRAGRTTKNRACARAKPCTRAPVCPRLKGPF